MDTADLCSPDFCSLVNYKVANHDYGDEKGMDTFVPLTRRQQEIVELVASGASNKEIAHRLVISTKTVKNTLTTVFAKTNTQSRTQLAVQWVRKGYGEFA
jgi:DNA-binding NarL/FixJ family response regulator